MSRVDVQKVTAPDDRTLPIFAEFEALADRIRMQAYKLFSRRGAGEGHALDDWLAAEREVCWPAAELVEHDGEFVFTVALAGFEPREITLTATPREIMVKANRSQRSESADKTAAELRWTEFRSNDVFRRVELPTPIDVDKVSANLKNGLLEIVAPKARGAAELAKNVEVTAQT